MAIADTTGRFFWPAISDYVGARNVFLTMFLLQGASFFLLPVLGSGSFVLFSVLFFVVLTCYGGGYGTIPALVDAYYGRGDIGTIYASIVIASDAAGPPGTVGGRDRLVRPRPLCFRRAHAGRRPHPAPSQATRASSLGRGWKLSATGLGMAPNPAVALNATIPHAIKVPAAVLIGHQDRRPTGFSRRSYGPRVAAIFSGRGQPLRTPL